MIGTATRLAAFLLALVSAPAFAQAPGPRHAEVEALLAADRAFSAQAADAATAADGLAPMFDAEAVMPVPGPGPGFATGRAAVIAAFRDSPAFREGRLSWTPIRGGISADGAHGFTFGYLALSGGDPARRDRKYLAYWIRRPQGWRVVAYRQLPRAPGAVSGAMLPPSLPASAARATIRPMAGGAAIDAHRASLHAAEQAFSDRAQIVGLRAAFREYGRADAMNMGGPGPIAIGLDAVTAGFPEGETASPVSWRTERSFIAPSGDLGVSIGTIRRNGPVPEGEPAGFPFFTIWRRDRPGEPWRYVAE